MYCLVKFCRMCLTFSGDMNNMCNDNIIEKATACIRELEFDHNLPSLICDECLETLDFFFNFRNRCLQSEFLLNCYIEKLTQSKSTNEFKTTDLRVNIVNNIGISPIKNDDNARKVKLNQNSDLQKLKVEKLDPNILASKSTQSFNLDEIDDVFSEEEIEEHRLNTRLPETFKRKSDAIEQSGKKLKTATSQSANSCVALNHSINPAMFTDITERVKLRKRQVQLNLMASSVVTTTGHQSPKAIRTYTNNKSSTIEKAQHSVEQVNATINESLKPTKSCIYTCNIKTPIPESEIATNTDLEKDITFHCIDTTSSANNKSTADKKKDSFLIPPVPNGTTLNPKIQVRNLASLKSTAAGEKNDLYKANFSNILKFNCLNSPTTPPSLNSVTASPFQLLIDTKGHSIGQLKIKYVPILQPVNPKTILSHLNSLNPSKSQSLLKINQKPTEKVTILPPLVNENSVLSHGSSEKCFETIKNEHNYSTETTNIEKNASTNSTANVNNKTKKYVVTSTTSINSGETVNLKEKIKETWAKYLVLKKINKQIPNTGKRPKTTQQISVLKPRLKPTETTANVSSESEQVPDMVVVPKEEIILSYLPSDNFKSISENHMEPVVKEEIVDNSDILTNNVDTFCNPFLKNFT